MGPTMIFYIIGLLRVVCYVNEITVIACQIVFIKIINENLIIDLYFSYNYHK